MEKSEREAERERLRERERERERERICFKENNTLTENKGVLWIFQIVPF